MQLPRPQSDDPQALRQAIAAAFDVLETRFLALVAAQGRTLAFGLGELNWPGATPFTDTLTVSHGLSGTPAWIGALAELKAGTTPCVVSYLNPDADSIDFRGYAADDSSPAASTKKNFYWAAIA